MLRVLDLSGTADVFVIREEVPATTGPSGTAEPTRPTVPAPPIVLPKSARIPAADGTALETPAADAG